MQTTVTSNRRLSGASVARPQDTQRIPMFKITPVDGKKPSFMIVATRSVPVGSRAKAFHFGTPAVQNLRSLATFMR